MLHLLKELAKRNHFNLDHVDLRFRSSLGIGERTNHSSIVSYVKDRIQPPYFLILHHFYFNFKNYDSKIVNQFEPTYINVIRNPVDWFVSLYGGRANLI